MVKDNTPAENGGEKQGVTRRQLLSRLWWGMAGVLGIEALGGLVFSLWPTMKPGSFGTKVKIATLEEARAMPVGAVTPYLEQRFYLCRVDSGLLAVYRKCTHVGCVVPWEADAPSEDDLAATGRFNCPCHGAIFDRHGLVKAGPAPRPLDLFPLSIEKGELVIDTGTIIQRTGFDESQVTKG